MDTTGTVPLADLGSIAAEPVDPMPASEMSGLLRDFDSAAIEMTFAALNEAMTDYFTGRTFFTFLGSDDDPTRAFSPAVLDRLGHSKRQSIRTVWSAATGRCFSSRSGAP